MPGSIPTGMGKPYRKPSLRNAVAGSIPTGMGKPPHCRPFARTKPSEAGSIPTGMGKPYRSHASFAVSFRAIAGSIPTGMGKPNFNHNVSVPHHVRLQVYPHGYGETRINFRRRKLELSGLSPRVWGNLNHHAASKPCRDGSIPTGMGKPPTQVIYPHGYGETVLQSKLPSGSIPTGMGKPSYVPDISTVLKVYPHGYGETVRPVGGQEPAWGSIPTGMGKPIPSKYPSASWRIRVYPHGYGETQDQDDRSARSYTGLSPRVWGNLHGIRGSIVEGSIPTGMGKPLQRIVCAVQHTLITVYPHGYGETS